MDPQDITPTLVSELVTPTTPRLTGGTLPTLNHAASVGTVGQELRTGIPN